MVCQSKAARLNDEAGNGTVENRVGVRALVDVVDKIAAEQKDQNDRPLNNIRMKMRMLN